MVMLCTAAHTVEILSSFLFAATAVSVPLAVTSIPWNVLHLCLLNWLTFSTDTASSRLMKISVIFSFRTELCFIVFSILLPVLFSTCSLKWTNPKTSLPVISWFFILFAGISNGILTFTAWFPKVATAMMGFGATSRIDNYDGVFVAFHYNRHEDEKYVEETLPAMDFIKRLLRHIPEKHFKMIRYGGIYARLPAGCFQFTRTPTTVFPIKKKRLQCD